MNELLELLLRCYPNPVTSKDIKNLIKLDSPTTRLYINALRREGQPICSCHKGYYLSVDRKEIANTIASLRNRISHINEAIAGLEMALTEIDTLQDDL